METVISIIVAIAILIVKVIEKKMKDSAQAPARPARPAQPTATRQYQTLEDLFPDLRAASEGVSEEHHEDILEEPEPIMDEKPTYVYEGFKSIQKETAPEVSKTTEVETSEKKEKIDPKKLVLYSEIMNRKY